MRRYITGILLFLLSAAVLDLLLGRAFDWLFVHAKGGDTQSQHYVADVMTDQVIVMGSSRATHHYVPQVITDSTGLSCFNCGRDGNGILYHYGRYLLLSQRYHPELLIYDVSYAFDIVSERDNLKYLDYLKPFALRPCIRQYVGQIAPKERVKQLSAMYRYNGKFGQVVVDNIRPNQHNDRGYKPYFTVMDYEPEPEPESVAPDDPVKLHYLRCLMRRCRQDGVRMLVCVSPMYHAPDIERYEPVFEMCRQEGVPLVSMYDDEVMSSDRSLYKDQIHLNNDGATMYTRSIMGKIRQVLGQ